MTEVAHLTYEWKQQKDFVDAAWEIVSQLEVYLEALQDEIQFGPTYYVTTSHANELAIHPIVLIMVTNKTVLFVAERLGRVVGLRRTALRAVEQHSMPWTVEATGTIITAMRGQGIATAIELAHLDFLQREANRSRCEITYHAKNLNLRDLFNARDDTQLPPAAKGILVKNLGKEQERWQALYGPMGKLGFAYGGKKTFYPQRGIEHHDRPLAEVRLRRVESKWLGRTLIGSEVERVREVIDPSEFRTQRLQFLRQDLLPRLKNAISLG